MNLRGLLTCFRRSVVSTGSRGEADAASYLEKQGYRVLGRNLRSRRGEVDLLAMAPDEKTVVIVEVKAGTGSGPVPEVHVNARKQKQLVTLACDLARKHGFTDRPIRFDIIGIDYPPNAPFQLRHHKGAFESHV